jgi:hypothetical protein
MCPGCGAHLEDTWTGDDCGKCGFQYIYEAADDSGERLRFARQPVQPGPSTTAAVVSLMFGYLAGAMIMPISVAQPDAGGIGFFIEFGPSSRPLLAFGLLGVAVLVLGVSGANRAPVTQSTPNDSESSSRGDQS